MQSVCALRALCGKSSAAQASFEIRQEYKKCCFRSKAELWSRETTNHRGGLTCNFYEIFTVISTLLLMPSVQESRLFTCTAGLWIVEFWRFVQPKTWRKIKRGCWPNRTARCGELMRKNAPPSFQPPTDSTDLSTSFLSSCPRLSYLFICSLLTTRVIIRGQGWFNGINLSLSLCLITGCLRGK